MTVFACVLRSGGIYTWDWVEKLRRGIAAHMGEEDYTFACLTDHQANSPGIQTIPLKHHWRGWWSKIELFRPELFKGETVVYFDLDTLIVGDLRPIVSEEHYFTMAHEFWRPHLYCSTAMSWRGDYSFIYDNFRANPEHWMAEYSSRKDGRIGDQAYIEDQLEDAEIHPDTFRDLIGRYSIASFKVDNARERIPPGAIAVTFHGRPKQHEKQAGWAYEMWRDL